jgi:hypothetical protein
LTQERMDRERRSHGDSTPASHTHPQHARALLIPSVRVTPPSCLVHVTPSMGTSLPRAATRPPPTSPCSPLRSPPPPQTPTLTHIHPSSHPCRVCCNHPPTFPTPPLLTCVMLRVALRLAPRARSPTTATPPAAKPLCSPLRLPLSPRTPSRAPPSWPRRADRLVAAWLMARPGLVPFVRSGRPPP